MDCKQAAQQPGCINDRIGNILASAVPVKGGVAAHTQASRREHSNNRQHNLRNKGGNFEMKKKNLAVKGMAMMMACAMVMGNTGMVAHATEYDDGCYHGDGRESGGSSASDGSDDIGGSGDSSYVEPSYSAPSESSSSSSSSESYESYDDSYVREDREAGGSSASDGSDNIGASAASYSTPARKTTAASTKASAGKETFRVAAKAEAGTYKVTHKGIDIATFALTDADAKAVACTKVALKQRTDGKWAINYEVADATGLTVGAPLDRTYMYSTLGVSYVTINDEVVIDIEAEAAAK